MSDHARRRQHAVRDDVARQLGRDIVNGTITREDAEQSLLGDFRDDGVPAHEARPIIRKALNEAIAAQQAHKLSIHDQPIDTALDALRAAGKNPKRHGSDWLCCCPAHDDKNPSLSVGIGAQGQVLFHCFAGCSHKDIADAIGIREVDLFADNRESRAQVPNKWPTYDKTPEQQGASSDTSPSQLRRNSDTTPEPLPTGYRTAQDAIAEYERTLGPPTRTWAYHDADGTEVGFTIRWDREGQKKAIRPISLHPDGLWRCCAMPSPRPMLNLPAILAADPSIPIYITEGEKAASAATDAGLLATTAAGGSNAGHLTDWTQLKGRKVILLPDRNEAGEKYACTIAKACREAGATTRIIELWATYPDIPEGGDIADIDIDPQTLGAAIAELTATPVKPNIPVISARQLILQNPTLRPVIIEGILRQGETMNVVAAPKIGKSWLIHYLGCSIASGRRWFDKTTTRGRVLIIDAELHKETLSHRLLAVQRKHGVTDDDMDRIDVWSVRGQRLTTDDLAAKFANQSAGYYSALILDAMYRFIPIGGEENANETMTNIYNTLDRIAMNSGTAVIVVHHASKGDQSEKSITDVGSGAGAQSRATDTHMVLRQHEEDDAAVVHAVTRSFPPMPPFVIRNTAPGWALAQDLSPDDIRRGTSRRDTQEKKPEQPKIEAWTTERFVAEIIGTDTLNREAIITRASTVAGMSRRQAESNIRIAVDQKLVTEIVGASNQPRQYTTGSGLPT